MINVRNATREEFTAELDRIRDANVKFLKKVAKMREYQRTYYETRDKDVLRQSVMLEKEVDNYLDRCFKAMEDQAEFMQKVNVVQDKLDKA